MKSINACTTLELILSLSSLIALGVVRPGYGGEYYIYQDPNGKLVLSNYSPPLGSNVITKETLSEVTDQQIMESQVRENQLTIDNRLSSLERSVGELTENLHAQNEAMTNVPEGYGDTNIAVGVAQAPAIVARPPHKHFNNPGNLRRNLPRVQSRPVAPAARSGGGGRAW